jgi:hypothetical protein
MSETTSLSDRAHLRKRIRGLDEAIGRSVADMADHVHGEGLRIWVRVEPQIPEGLAIATGWTVHVTARIPGLGEITMPVIPDEHNPNPGKVIHSDDKPWVFPSMQAAERGGEVARAALEDQVRELTQPARRGPAP